ncbi:MAG: DUF3108 domain-containing protein [Bryobacteraceae bacterium]|jgi:hypothetical protein
MKALPFLLAACLALAQAPGPSPKAPPEPFADESLRYSVNWPSGLSLGEAQFLAKRAGDRWRFALSLDAAVPGFIVSDSYQSTAAKDFCSVEFVKTSTHGQKKASERIAFDAQRGIATRQTLIADGGKSEVSAPGCARDALAFLYFLRLELSQGRLPPPQTVFFGAPYQLKLEYGGTQTIRVNDRPMEAERLRASLKGPASETNFELFFARDAVRTPLMIRVPFAAGVFSLELVR